MKFRFSMIFILAAVTMSALSLPDLTVARDRQDLATLDRDIASLDSNAKRSDVLYMLATAYSYAAEVAMEQHQKIKSEDYAEKGYPIAAKVADWNQGSAEDHRLLGQICGQVIPASPVMGTMKYGPCAKAEIDKAIQLNPKLALAYVSRGVGLYYLPASFGGGIDPALKEIDHAISIDPKLSEAFLWRGVVLSKAKRPAEALKAFQAALKLDPNRLWAQQQIAKLPH